MTGPLPRILHRRTLETGAMPLSPFPGQRARSGQPQAAGKSKQPKCLGTKASSLPRYRSPVPLLKNKGYDYSLSFLKPSFLLWEIHAKVGFQGYDSRRLAGPYSSLQLPGSLAEPRSPARCAPLGPGWTLAPRSCGRAHGKVAGREGWQRRGRGPRSPREGEPRTAPPAAGSRGGRGGGGGHKVSASAAAPCSAERAPLRPAGPPSYPPGPKPTFLPPGDTRLAATGVSADRPGRLVRAAAPGKGARPWRARAAPAPRCVQLRPGPTRDPPRPRAPWGRGSYHAPRAPAAAVLRAAAAAHAPPGPCWRGPVRGGRGPRRSRRRRRRRRLWK